MDNIDRKILFELQNDARMTITELSQRVALSKTPCLERVRKLEGSGHIQGYHARLNASLLGAGHIAYVQVILKDTTTQKLNDFNDAVRAIPEIQSCHMIAGGFDYLLKVRTNDIAHYRTILGEKLALLPHVQQTTTYVVMESVKDNTSIPIPG